MSNQVTLPCGICKRPPRPGDDLKKIRLHQDDMVDKKYPEPKAPGLYQCCPECYDLYLPHVAARLGKTHDQMGHNDAI